MRIGLLDPAWVEKRKLDIQRKKDEEDYYAPDSQVAAALDQVAKHRTDIFGIEETGVGRKIGEKEKFNPKLDGMAMLKLLIRQLNRDTRLMMKLHVNVVISLTRVSYQKI